MNQCRDLTRNGGGIFWTHRKIGCINFKPQYLLNIQVRQTIYTAFERGASNQFLNCQNQFLNCWVGGPLPWAPCAKCSAGVLLATLAPDFAPKLCTRGVSGCSSACFNTRQGPFDLILSPVWLSSYTRKTEILRYFSDFLVPFFYFGGIKSTFRGNAFNAMYFCLKILFKSFLYHTVDWCL